MKRFYGALILGGVLAMSGCGSSLASWIVNTRDHQGDLALDSRHFKDAANAYRLALQVDSADEHAKTGLVESQADLAEMYYNDSQFEDALAALAVASKIEPQSVRVAGLKADIDSAQIKRQIVLSNYPTYAQMTLAISHGYSTLRAQNNEILYLIKRFGYTYDTADLATAIRSSSDLALDVNKLTTRLISLRNLVSAGTIAPDAGNGTVSTGGASLLPVP